MRGSQAARAAVQSTTANQIPGNGPGTPARIGDNRDPRDRVRLPDSAPRQHYRDLPLVSGSTFSEVETIRAALRDLERGAFTAPADLAEAMIVDDRINGILQTRVDALFGLPLAIEPGKDTAAGRAVADELRESWDQMFPLEELRRFLWWALQLRYSPAELVWKTEADRWTFRLKCWNPRYSFWRWDLRSYQLVSMDGTIEAIPGDAQWVIYTPDGYQRGWVHGFVRPLARLFLMRQWAYRDWARWSEVHGMPIRKGIVPAAASAPVAENFVRDLMAIGNEATVRLERDENGRGFDIELVEAASQSWEGFQRLAERCEENAAVMLLGQNLTTSAKSGGSYALGAVHDRIRLDRVEADAASLTPVLTEQAIKPWVLYNWGDERLIPRVRWLTDTNSTVNPQTGLAGPQVLALTEIVKSVARGEIPRDTGVQILASAYPVSVDQAEKIMGDVGEGFKPTAVAIPPKPPEPSAPPAEEESIDAPSDR